MSCWLEVGAAIGVAEAHAEHSLPSVLSKPPEARASSRAASHEVFPEQRVYPVWPWLHPVRWQYRRCLGDWATTCANRWSAAQAARRRSDSVENASTARGIASARLSRSPAPAPRMGRSTLDVCTRTRPRRRPGCQESARLQAHGGEVLDRGIAAAPVAAGLLIPAHTEHCSGHVSP